MIILLLFIPLPNLFLISLQKYMRYLMSYITLFIIIACVWTYFFSDVLLCDSFTDDMNKGRIARTPLLQAGQTVATLAHNTHPVTGGHITVGRAHTGTTTKILGIMVDNWNTAMAGYRQGNQPFNMNLAKVLYELRAAGKISCSYSMLDHHAPGHFNSQYVQGFKASQGPSVASTAQGFGEFRISDKLLNGLAEQF